MFKWEAKELGGRELHPFPPPPLDKTLHDYDGNSELLIPTLNLSWHWYYW